MAEYEVMGSHCNNESQTSKKEKKNWGKRGEMKTNQKKIKRSQANKMLGFLCNKQFQIFSH